MLLGAVTYLNWPHEPAEDVGLEAFGVLLVSGTVFAIGLVMLLASIVARSLHRRRLPSIDLPRARPISEPRAHVGV